MTVRMIRPLAAALGVWAGGAAVAAEPAAPATQMAPSANQQLADTIANRLTGLAAAQGADVSMNTQDGVVTVTGFALDAAQKAAILDEVRVVPGVKLVRDGMKVNPTGPNEGIRQVQATESVPSALPPIGGMPMGGMPMGPVARPMSSVVPPTAMAHGGAGLPHTANPVIEPAPVGGVPATAAGNAPPLPPHAWPTYAPYNNYSRVGYPQAYPYNAFPFIGPFYPFPKVPLGWRSVKLEWEDGHWWLGKTATPHDYWRVRFW